MKFDNPERAAAKLAVAFLVLGALLVLVGLTFALVGDHSYSPVSLEDIEALEADYYGQPEVVFIANLAEFGSVYQKSVLLGVCGAGFMGVGGVLLVFATGSFFKFVSRVAEFLQIDIVQILLMVMMIGGVTAKLFWNGVSDYLVGFMIGIFGVLIGWTAKKHLSLIEFSRQAG